MPTTKLASYPLVPGSDISDPTTPASLALKECIDAVSQQPSLQAFHVGMQLEHPETVQAMITYGPPLSTAFVFLKLTPIHSLERYSCTQTLASTLQI
jgi:hypothetical protein